MFDLDRHFAAGQAEAAGGVAPFASAGVATCPCGRADGLGPLGRTFCPCRAGAERRARFEAGVTLGDPSCRTPSRLDGASLAGCRVAVRDAPTADARAERHAATDAAERFDRAVRDGRAPTAGLCLFGPVGTGKSYTLAALAAALRDRGVPVVWTTYASMVGAVQRHYGTDRAGTVEVNLQRCPVLAVDDLGDPFRTRGAVQETEDRRRIVLGVVAERAAHFRPTLISANYGSLQEMADQFDPRIADRVREACEVHTLGGRSLRRPPSI